MPCMTVHTIAVSACVLPQLIFVYKSVALQQDRQSADNLSVAASLLRGKFLEHEPTSVIMPGKI